MAENTQGASASEAKKSKVIKSLNREAERLDRFIVKHGDLPIGTPPDDESDTPASPPFDRFNLEDVALSFLTLRKLADRVIVGGPDEDNADLMWSISHLAEKWEVEARQAVHALIPQPLQNRTADVLLRLHALCEEGVIIINPQATKLSADDAAHFFACVRQQLRGGAQ